MAETGTPPLDLRQVFARPWAGEAELWQPRWLRLFPAPRQWTFRTEMLDTIELRFLGIRIGRVMMHLRPM